MLTMRRPPANNTYRQNPDDITEDLNPAMPEAGIPSRPFSYMSQNIPFSLGTVLQNLINICLISTSSPSSNFKFKVFVKAGLGAE